ncbi:MAG TPA: hypothetical protein VFW96_11445 [Thermomicrobiales bacterium]|nr:hypothetical protein [Thermomicrobiales bacterium]
MSGEEMEGGADPGHEAGGAGRLAGGCGVSLFRAVGPHELADIQERGGFRPDPDGRSYEFGKLFATSAEDAARFGRINVALGGRSFTIVEASIPVSLVDRYYRSAMDRMAVVLIEVAQLAEFNAAARIRVLPSVPNVPLPIRGR